MLTALSITVTIAVFATFMKTFYDATCLFFCYRAKASRPCLKTNSLSCLLFVCLVGFLTSSSTTRLYRGRAPRQERLTILRAATHETELGDHDFCLSRSHYTDTDPTCRERAATAGIEPGTSSPAVARSTAELPRPPPPPPIMLSCRNRPKMLVSVLPGQLVVSVDGPGSPTQNQCLKNSITPRLRIPLSVLGPPDHKLARDSILFSIIAQLALQIQRVCVCDFLQCLFPASMTYFHVLLIGVRSTDITVHGGHVTGL